MRELRVWWMYSYWGSKTRRRLVAAQTQKEAAKALQVPLSCFREYAMETGNAQDLELALKNPGQVYEVPE